MLISYNSLYIFISHHQLSIIWLPIYYICTQLILTVRLHEFTSKKAYRFGGRMLRNGW